MKLYFKKSDYNTILSTAPPAFQMNPAASLQEQKKTKKSPSRRSISSQMWMPAENIFPWIPKSSLQPSKMPEQTDTRSSETSIPIRNPHPAHPKKTNAWHLTRPLNTLSSPLWKKEIRYSKHSESTKKKMSRSTRSRSQNKVRKKKP